MAENRARSQKIWAALSAIEKDIDLIIQEVDQAETPDTQAVNTFAHRIRGNTASAALALSAIELDLDSIFGDGA